MQSEPGYPGHDAHPRRPSEPLLLGACTLVITYPVVNVCYTAETAATVGYGVHHPRRQKEKQLPWFPHRARRRYKIPFLPTARRNGKVALGYFRRRDVTAVISYNTCVISYWRYRLGVMTILRRTTSPGRAETNGSRVEVRSKHPFVHDTIPTRPSPPTRATPTTLRLSVYPLST